MVPACAQAHAAAQGPTDTGARRTHRRGDPALRALVSARAPHPWAERGADSPLRAVPAESAPGRPAARGPAARPLGEQVSAAPPPLPLYASSALPRLQNLRPSGATGPLLQLSCLSQPRPSPTESGPEPERGQPPETEMKPSPAAASVLRDTLPPSVPNPPPHPPPPSIWDRAPERPIPAARRGWDGLAPGRPSSCQREDPGRKALRPEGPRGTCLRTPEADGYADPIAKATLEGSQGAGDLSLHGV